MKNIKENILTICIAGLVALFGFSLISYVFLGDTVRTEIVSASSIRSKDIVETERLSEDDPDYYPVVNTTKEVSITKYYRTVKVIVDGEEYELDMDSETKFMLPGPGRKITVSRNYDGSLYLEHPLRNIIMGAVMGFGGLAIIISICKPDFEKIWSSKKKQKKRKKT